MNCSRSSATAPRGLHYSLATLPAGTHVLIIDWGAATGATLHQALGIAADSGAQTVQALVLTSQLLPADEAAVRKVRVVAGRTTAVGPIAEGSQLPLSDAADKD